MSPIAAVLALALVNGQPAAADEAFLIEPDDAPTSLENALDGAWSALNEAGTYTCTDDRADRIYRPAWQRLHRSMAAAERLLDRPLRTGIYVNSCRRHINWSRFSRAMRRADRSLRRADAMIRFGRPN